MKPSPCTRSARSFGSNIQRPLLLHIAAENRFCPPPARDAIVQALQGHPQVQLFVYADVDHAYARPGGDHYHRPSALLAQ
jgi:carboxymethylenebutenolidase